MRIFRFAGWPWLLVLALIIVLTACDHKATSDTPSRAAGLRVVTSIFPLADLAGQIGGDHVQAEALLPTGASPHSYEPGTADAKKLAAADLIILVGQGLDRFAENLAASYPEKPVLVITKGMKLQPNPETLLTEGAGREARAGKADHGAYDPHVWLDPVLVRDVIAPAIATRLQELDPPGAGTYRENLTHLQAEITTLDRETRQQTGTFSQRRFIVFHSGWHYFAQRYNLEDINVEEFPNQEPSARDLMEIVTLARDTGVRAVFTEPQFSPKAAQVIADEFGGRVLTLDPLGGTGREGRDSYLDLMRWNLSRLAEGLK